MPSFSSSGMKINKKRSKLKQKLFEVKILNKKTHNFKMNIFIFKKDVKIKQQRLIKQAKPNVTEELIRGIKLNRRYIYVRNLL